MSRAFAERTAPAASSAHARATAPALTGRARPKLSDFFGRSTREFNFATIPISAPSLIPVDGGTDADIDLTPDGGTGGGGGGGGGGAAATDCDVPRSMDKVTSGSFQGGLTVGSYFPSLATRGYPATAGPFDLGNRAGSSVQFIGAIPSPCQPGRFSFAQTATVSRMRVNGTPAPEEGRTVDDVARSGQNVSAPPFRQEFLGGAAAPYGFLGGTSPLGYIISFLDPPSIPYGPGSSGELVVSFTSSLVGAAGRKSVSWSVSVEVVNGAVTRNTVT